MRVVRKMISIIITIVLISSMIIGNITIVLAQNSDSTVDISRLEDLYNECKEVERGTYTHGSWGYFQDALGLTHYTLYGPEEITAEAIDFAYDYLSISYSWLDEHDGSEPEPDRTVLEEAYNNYKNIEQGDYNEVSWGYFIDALEEAYRMLYEYEYIYQDYIDSNLESLERAYDRLEEGEPDFTELENAYHRFKDIQQGDYNLGSWSWFKQHLNYIGDILTDQHERERTTQKEIDYLLSELLKFYNNLEIGEVELNELEDLFNLFNEKYGDIDPEDFFTNFDDIELFENTMYNIPIYLSDREYVTQNETDELIKSIQDLQEKLENTNVDSDHKEDDDTPDERDVDGSEDVEDNNDSEETEDESTQGSTSESNGEEDESSQEGTIEPKEKEDSFHEDNDSSKEVDEEAESVSNISKEQSADENSVKNGLKTSNKTVEEYISDNVLPTTSTNNFNMMILGMLLVIEGIFLYVYFSFISFLRRRFNIF